MLTQYLEWKAVSNKTAAKNYKYCLQKFLNFVKKDIPQIEIGDIVAFCKEQTVSQTTIAYYLNAIKDFLRFRGKELPIKLPRYKYNPYAPVTREEFDLMDDFLATEESNFANLQKRLIIHFLFWTGVRVAELVDIKWTDINQSEESLYIENKKNKESRWIFWPTQTHLLLLEYIRERKNYNGESLFVTFEGSMTIRTVQRFLSDLGKKLCITYSLSPHCFRHGYAMYRINKGIELRALQRLMGHNSPMSTLRYVNYSKDEISKKALEYLT